MKRVIVIGCPGSGKTTFSEKLAEATGIPLIYLDAIWHKPDRTHIERAEFDRILSEIFARESWIMDGNYQRTLEMRLCESDSVFLFDLSAEDCILGARARLGKKRPDMPWIDKEPDPFLESEILSFREKVLPVIYELLEKCKDGREITVFRSRDEADGFIQSLSQK